MKVTYEGLVQVPVQVVLGPEAPKQLSHLVVLVLLCCRMWLSVGVHYCLLSFDLLI